MPTTEWVVTREEGEKLAKKHGFEYHEVSGLENTGIDAPINALARLMCVKYEALEGGFNNAFHDLNYDTPGMGPSGFKLDDGQDEGGFGCCATRSGKKKSDQASCC